MFTPYLSFVVASRNDNHGGAIHDRTQTFIDTLAEQCTRHQLSAELIIVEWNPPADNPPLREVYNPAPPSSFFNTRFITVPNVVHNSLPHSDVLPFYQMIAKNVGIRRAKGTFVLATNIDILFSEELIAFFATRLLRHDAQYRIDRYDMGVFTVPKQLFGAELMRFCSNNIVRVQSRYGTYTIGETPPSGNQGALHSNACGDFALMSRANWERIKGYPEFGLFSIYIDGLALHAAQAIGLEQVILEPPLVIYHIEHQSGWVLDKKTCESRPCLNYERVYIPMCRKMLATGLPLSINSHTWGYSDKMFAESTWYPTLAQEAIFIHWTEIIANFEKRLYYRDQSLASFKSLYKLASDFNPTVIVELGTLSGMSLRTWLMAAQNAKVKCIDLSFNALRHSAQYIPFDTARVEMIQSDILKVDFKTLWTSSDKVLFFVDAHDAEKAPIMAHVLKNAVPYLPEGSLVVVDDIWHSPEQATEASARTLFAEHVLHEIDELQLFHAHYAPYHAGGSFFGFLEVVPLLRYVNQHGIKLLHEQGCKHVAFFTGQTVSRKEKFDALGFRQFCGVVEHHPLDGVAPTSPLGAKLAIKAHALYSHNQMGEAVTLLLDFVTTQPTGGEMGGLWYALAVCLLRMGEPDTARQCLACESQGANPHPNTAKLLGDVQERFFPLEQTKTPRRPGLTLFSAPKPFTGHEGIIQKNAILSWTKLTPKPEIILFGDEEGIAELATELDLKHIPTVRRNDYGTPLVNDIFLQAQQRSDTELLAYVNADIILFDDFIHATEKAATSHQQFLMIGQRWDVDVIQYLDFSNPEQAAALQEKLRAEGELHAATGMDYFVFRPGLWPNIPPFALGRTMWDIWLHSDAACRVTTLDATNKAIIIHQNHGYNHLAGGIHEAWNGVEAMRNKSLAIGTPIYTVADATEIL